MTKLFNLLMLKRIRRIIVVVLKRKYVGNVFQVGILHYLLCNFSEPLMNESLHRGPWPHRISKGVENGTSSSLAEACKEGLC